MAYTTNRIKIEYCVPCGYLPQASELATELLQHLRHDVEAIELVTGDSGVFDVKLNDDLIYSHFDTGTFPTTKEILTTVKDKGQ
ncbi:MAG: SelT/SelW/SelH family protein [SAR202 cluster bacterium]|nr:SelT/SelW/SelH family protein [SAR202 cluster bacterium]|tara:strand:+ start:109 stop:360 length:252 start_codon:yes stop_codon:yes gene_type:complete